MILAPYMFHQANLRVADVGPTTINGVTKPRSLYMMWAETISAPTDCIGRLAFRGGQTGRPRPSIP